MTTRRELRQFGLTVGAAFGALALVALWRGRALPATILGAVGATLLALGALAPGALDGVQRRWMAGARAMSRVTTPLFMGVVYFGVFTPLGVALRLVRRRGLSPRRDADTFLVPRPPGATRSDLRRQF